MTEQELNVLMKFYDKKKMLMELLTKYYDIAEDALYSGEGMEEALEYIGLKSDEMLAKL